MASKGNYYHENTFDLAYLWSKEFCLKNSQKSYFRVGFGILFLSAES